MFLSFSVLSLKNAVKDVRELKWQCRQLMFSVPLNREKTYLYHENVTVLLTIFLRVYIIQY